MRGTRAAHELSLRHAHTRRRRKTEHSGVKLPPRPSCGVVPCPLPCVCGGNARLHPWRGGAGDVGCVRGGEALQEADFADGPWPARSSTRRLEVRNEALKVRASTRFCAYLAPRLWPRSRFSRSQRAPPERLGTSKISPVAKIGARKTEHRLNPSPARPCSGQDAAVRASDRP